MNIYQLETPVLVVDKAIFEKNLNTMAELAKGKKAKLRPHFKSHKCSKISLMQLKLGAKGITASKISEAEVLVKSGVKDILIACSDKLFLRQSRDE